MRQNLGFLPTDIQRKILKKLKITVIDKTSTELYKLVLMSFQKIEILLKNKEILKK